MRQHVDRHVIVLETGPVRAVFRKRADQGSWFGVEAATAASASDRQSSAAVQGRRSIAGGRT